MILKEQCIVKFNNPNRNGIIYSSDCFNLDDPIIQERLKAGAFFGEFGLSKDKLEIDLTKVSHRVVNLYKKEDGLYADIETLETPCGKLLEDIINKGNQVNFRSNGSGYLIEREDGLMEVTDYTLESINYTFNQA